jgi:hypothetical protein
VEGGWNVSQIILHSFEDEKKGFSITRPRLEFALVLIARQALSDVTKYHR